ncbi:MAG: sulfatase family protein [Planctomycetota bacterium]|jgi:arylsulfatase A-like enzyme
MPESEKKVFNEKVRCRWWLWFTTTIVSCFILFYLLSVTSFIISLSGESKDFSSAVSENYAGYIAWLHIKLATGYLSVAAFLVIVFFPIVRIWQIRRPVGRRWMILRAVVIVLVMTLFVGTRILQQPYLARGWFGAIYHGIAWITPGFVKMIISYSSVVIVVGIVLASILLYAHLAYQHIRSRRIRSGVAAASALICLLTGTLVTANAHADGEDSGVRKPWNILILSCDSLRADRLSCNGYHIKTTPNIDRFAEKSINFTRAMTPIADTLSSWVSMFTSQYPVEHGIRYIYPQPDVLRRAEKDRVYLPKLLAKKGYRTTAIGDWCGSCFKWLDMGFDEIDVSDVQTFKVVLSEFIYRHHLVILMFFQNPLGRQMFPELENFSFLLTPEKVTDRVIDRLEDYSDSSEPFFMTVFYSCTHLPYKSNEPYARKYRNPNYRGPNEFEIHLKIADIIRQDWPGSSDHRELQQIHDLYNRSLSEFDGNIGEILEALVELGLLENTIVIISADHGEDLYDPGTTLGHGLNFNGGDQSNNVPLIVYVPEKLCPPGKVDRTVRLVDVAPTLCDLLGIEKPESFRGKTLVPYLEGWDDNLGLIFYGEEGFCFGEKKPAYDALWDMPPVTELFELDNMFDSNLIVKQKYHDPLIEARERCIATDRWKVVRRVLKNGPSYSLYDTVNDPFCLNDLSSERPDIFAPMVRMLNEWIETGADYSGKLRLFPDK